MVFIPISHGSAQDWFLENHLKAYNVIHGHGLTVYQILSKDSIDNALRLPCVTFIYKKIPYLGLYNAQDFAQILYFVGGVRIINKNNVFHSFPDREITCLPCFFVCYCQHAKLDISSYENTNKTQHI